MNEERLKRLARSGDPDAIAALNREAVRRSTSTRKRQEARPLAQHGYGYGYGYSYGSWYGEGSGYGYGNGGGNGNGYGGGEGGGYGRRLE